VICGFSSDAPPFLVFLRRLPLDTGPMPYSVSRVLLHMSPILSRSGLYFPNCTNPGRFPRRRYRDRFFTPSSPPILAVLQLVVSFFSPPVVKVFDLVVFLQILNWPLTPFFLDRFPFFPRWLFEYFAGPAFHPNSFPLPETFVHSCLFFFTPLNPVFSLVFFVGLALSLTSFGRCLDFSPPRVDPLKYFQRLFAKCSISGHPSSFLYSQDP